MPVRTLYTSLVLRCRFFRALLPPSFDRLSSSKGATLGRAAFAVSRPVGHSHNVLHRLRDVAVVRGLCYC